MFYHLVDTFKSFKSPQLYISNTYFLYMPYRQYHNSSNTTQTQQRNRDNLSQVVTQFYHIHLLFLHQDSAELIHPGLGHFFCLTFVLNGHVFGLWCRSQVGGSIVFQIMSGSPKQCNTNQSKVKSSELNLSDSNHHTDQTSSDKWTH